MELAKMTSKGQLTVPVSIRKKLGIGAGDQLLFYEREGQIILAPVTPVRWLPPRLLPRSNMFIPLRKSAKLPFPSRSAISSSALRCLVPMPGGRQPRRVTSIFVPMFPRTLACSV